MAGQREGDQRHHSAHLNGKSRQETERWPSRVHLVFISGPRFALHSLCFTGRNKKRRRRIWYIIGEKKNNKNKHNKQNTEKKTEGRVFSACKMKTRKNGKERKKERRRKKKKHTLTWKRSNQLPAVAIENFQSKQKQKYGRQKINAIDGKTSWTLAYQLTLAWLLQLSHSCNDEWCYLF